MSDQSKVMVTAKEDEFDYLQIPAGEYAVESGFEKLKRKCKENPAVPFGLVVVTGVLANGVTQTMRGNSLKAQKMMRMRVFAQGCTVLALLGGMAMQQQKKH